MSADLMDPQVRAAVFATVTQDEAMRILRSRAGRPWNRAVAEIIIEGLAPLDDPGEHRMSENRGPQIAADASAQPTEGLQYQETSPQDDHEADLWRYYFMPGPWRGANNGGCP